MKTCYKCKLTKPLTDFCSDSSTKDGLKTQCRGCAREYYLANRNLKYPRPVVPEGSKYCFCCKLIKSTTDFGRSKKAGDALQSYCKACILGHVRKRPGLQAKYQRKCRYGLTHEDYLKMLTEQNSSCAICGRADRKLVVDHDHVTGKVRALLCEKCNFAIGNLGDSAKLATAAAEYLTLHAASSSCPPIV